MRAIFVCDKKDNIKWVFDSEAVNRIRSHVVLDMNPYSKTDIAVNPDAFADVEIIFSTWGMPCFTEKEIEESFPSLRAVFYAAGSVQKFARPFISKGVKVFSAWAANAVPVAEYTVAQIILANKGYFAHTRLMQSEALAEASRTRELYSGNYNTKIGLVGCGMIGSLVAEMLKNYKLDVFVYDPYLSDSRANALGVTSVTLNELFEKCSVISNHLANNEQTVGIFDYSLFSKMKPYSTFINTGRGAQVVESDLARILKERPDITALLDVTYPEPPALGHPFYSLSNCFLTPHIAGSYGNEVVRMGAYMADELERFIGNTLCKYEVTEKMLETMA